MQAKQYEINEAGEWVFVGMAPSLIFAEQSNPAYANCPKNTAGGFSSDQQLFDGMGIVS